MWSGGLGFYMGGASDDGTFYLRLLPCSLGVVDSGGFGVGPTSEASAGITSQANFPVQHVSIHLSLLGL